MCRVLADVVFFASFPFSVCDWLTFMPQYLYNDSGYFHNNNDIDSVSMEYKNKTKTIHFSVFYECKEYNKYIFIRVYFIYSHINLWLPHISRERWKGI